MSDQNALEQAAVSKFHASPAFAASATTNIEHGHASFASTPLRSRVDWIDIAKGITIILVVLFHTVRGLLAAGILPGTPFVLGVDYVVYTFHMPVFFFLSGLFLKRTLQKPPGTFWMGRFTGLLLPYLIWMTVELVILTKTAGMVNMAHVGLSVVTYLWEPIAPFWFLYSLFCVHALLYGLRGWSNRAILVLTAVAYIVSLAWSARFGDMIHVRTALGLVFVVLGMRLADHTDLRWHPAALAALALALFACVIATALPFFAWGLPPNAALPSGILGVAGMVVLAQALTHPALSPWLEPIRFLGRISLTVLVVHIIGTAGSRILLVKFLGVHNPAIHLVVDTGMGLAISVAVQWAAWSVGITRWLGLPNLPVRLAAITLRAGVREASRS